MRIEVRGVFDGEGLVTGAAAVSAAAGVESQIGVWVEVIDAHAVLAPLVYEHEAVDDGLDLRGEPQEGGTRSSS